jgi:hypothetical protein
MLAPSLSSLWLRRGKAACTPIPIGNREDIVQRTELYKQFQEDMTKSDVNTRQLDSKHCYYGIKRRETIQEEE